MPGWRVVTEVADGSEELMEVAVEEAGGSGWQSGSTGEGGKDEVPE